nr:hypothetical protein [Tanacetum cinerariifolium]
MDVPIEQDDLNQKFLTSLAPEWLVYTIVWRNIDDLDTISLDDVYNHFKVFEPEVQKRVGLNSQNMAFISSSNTSSGKKDGHKIKLGFVKHDDDRFWKKTGKKIAIQGSDVAGFDKSKVECFNCHKISHFAIEYRSTRSQDRGKKESYKKDLRVEEPAPKAMIAIYGIEWDWSYMAEEDEASKNHALVADEEEVPTEYALMAKSSSSSDNKVYDYSFCSKSCRKKTKNLNTKTSKLNEELSDSKTDLYNYKRGLSQAEARLVGFKENEIKYCEKIRVLERDIELKDNKIKYLRNVLKEVKKEKESLDFKIKNFKNASKDLDRLLGSQKLDKDMKSVGFNEYCAIPPPPAQVYSPPKKDLSWMGLPKFVDDTITDYTRPTTSIGVSKSVTQEQEER